jgi:uncharacterized protein
MQVKFMKYLCPICRRPTDSEADSDFPFCSERCRLVDLGNWATERYVVSEPVFEEDEIEEGNFDSQRESGRESNADDDGEDSGSGAGSDPGGNGSRLRQRRGNSGEKSSDKHDGNS